MGCLSCKSVETRRRESSPYVDSHRFHPAPLPNGGAYRDGNDGYAPPSDGCGPGNIFPATAALRVVQRDPSYAGRYEQVRRGSANVVGGGTAPAPREFDPRAAADVDVDQGPRHNSSSPYYEPAPPIAAGARVVRVTTPSSAQPQYADTVLTPRSRRGTPRSTPKATDPRSGGRITAPYGDDDDGASSFASNDEELVMICTDCLLEIIDNKTPQVCRVTGKHHY